MTDHRNKFVHLALGCLLAAPLVAGCGKTIGETIDDAAGEIVTKHSFNVGFAADTPEGLLVPNVKNVEQNCVQILMLFLLIIYQCILEYLVMVF